VLGGAAFRAERVGACGFFEPPVEDGLTFDTAPWRAHAAPRCESDCDTAAMLADWHGYFGGAKDDAEWKKTLFDASADRLELEARTARGAKLKAALAYVALARRVEPSATLLRSDDRGASFTPPSAKLLDAARAGFKSAPDAFLAQRYAYQVVRILFYQREWRAAIAFFDQNAALLAKPSPYIAWQARWYVAGALKRAGSRARASLELARIHAGSSELARSAMNDFQPMEQGDWLQSLKLATTVRDKTLLWALVGDKQADGLTAAREIAKLDPRSDLLGELIVAELGRVEQIVSPLTEKPDPTSVAARDKGLGELNALATNLAATPGVDRPWLLELVLGHIAARRGQLADARAHLGKAIAGSREPRVADQARASLAIALARDWQINPQHEDEVARELAAIDPKFAPLPAVKGNVRLLLGNAYKVANRLVEAEYLRPGSIVRWHDAAFIKEMIARAQQTGGAWDRFLLDGPYDRTRLARELAFRYVLDGDFAAAQRVFSPAGDGPLGTDPFVMHIRDCHDCDHERYATAAWTRGNVIAKLVELAPKANGTGDAAAEAALSIGHVLYNVTWSGNARVMFDGTNQETRDASAALRWYKRAYELAKSRELKVKAAFMAAKAERAVMASKLDVYQSLGRSDIAKTWYPTVRKYADTKYYKEILGECGYFSEWAASH
jgi:hypothetical protein